MKNRETTTRPRKKKKKRLSYYLLLYIMLGFGAVVTLVVLSLTVLFHIDNVKVAGESIYSAEQIVSASGVKKDVNIFTADLSGVSDNISKALPYIESVKVKRVFPSVVKLTVSKALPYAQIESGSKYIIINSSGKCLEATDAPVKGIPVVRGLSVSTSVPGSTLAFSGKDKDKYISEIKLLCDSLQKNKINNVTVITIKDLQDASVTYNNRVVLQLGSTGNLDQKLQYALLVLKQQANSTQTGVLNLSRIPNDKQQAFFTSCILTDDQVADVIKKD